MPAPVSSQAPSDAQVPTAGLGVRGIRLAYHPSHPVIEDLSTAITPGAVTMIVGPNACGKSTLLRAMSRVLSPSSGQVVLDGRDIATLAPRKLARRVGMLAQSSIAPPGITVHELVARGRYPYQSLLRQWSADDDAAVTEAMERTDVVALARRQVSSLSGGQRQRVWVAMALAQRTDILLLDEPTTYLDVAHQLRVMEIISALNRVHGMTILMVLHDMAHAMQYADDIVLVQAGRVRATGTPAEVLTEERIADVFGVRVEIFTNSRGIRVPSPVALVGE